MCMFKNKTCYYLLWNLLKKIFPIFKTSQKHHQQLRSCPVVAMNVWPKKSAKNSTKSSRKHVFAAMSFANATTTTSTSVATIERRNAMASMTARTTQMNSTSIAPLASSTTRPNIMMTNTSVCVTRTTCGSSSSSCFIWTTFTVNCTAALPSERTCLRATARWQMIEFAWILCSLPRTTRPASFPPDWSPFSA